MKYRLVAVALCFACGFARAEGPLIGLEFESEKNRASGITNHAVDIVPGWEFADDRIINRVELLIERNQDTSSDADGVTAKANQLFVRLRHDGDFNDTLGYYVRGGIGRNFNNEHSYNFAYIEPGIEYKLSPNAIDSAAGHHITQFRTGPSLDIDKGNELEFLYTRGHGDEDLASWVVEYIHKF
jgi:hypothetical protein